MVSARKECTRKAQSNKNENQTYRTMIEPYGTAIEPIHSKLSNGQVLPNL